MHSKSALSQLASNPRSIGAVVLAFISVTTQIVALAAATGWSPGGTPAPAHPTMASALIHSLQCAGSAPKGQACAAPSPAALAGADQHERVVVPTGASPCPDSGPGASCINHPITADPGNSAVPDGFPACPVDPSKAVSAPGSCAAPAAVPSPTASPTPSVSPVPAQPFVPAASVTPTLTLEGSSSAITGGNAMALRAKSSLNVSGTPFAIEIFDMTTGGAVAACTESAECVVSFSAKSGLHSFVAYVASPTPNVPTSGIVATSNRVDVHFLGVSLAATEPTVVAPGSAVTFTATATEEVSNVGYRIEMHDAASGATLTFCSRGTTCSMSLVEPSGGVHKLVATLAPLSPADQSGSSDINAKSVAVAGTWLAVKLSASAISPSGGGTTTLTAAANADLSKTPYSLYMFDQSGTQVGSACNAAICTATSPVATGSVQSFIAVIARTPAAGAPRGSLTSVVNKVPVSMAGLDVQVASTPVKPSRTLWGVDSCKRITDDPSGASGLLPQVTGILGAPDFWGRYLPNTGNCPGLNPAEITAAHDRHIGILPIYNDYDCSAVSGNATGAAYATAAIGWLQNDLIPQGTVIAIDIEPEGAACPGAANVDSGFIQGWYDGLMNAGYVPAFYGNTSPNSAFANAWCATVQQRPEIADNSYLWSFEPSLVGSFSKATAPAFGSYSTTCAGHYAAWQYVLSAGGNPDVDQDEAGSDLPLWYP